MASHSSSSFIRSWVCHECLDGPHNYAIVRSCTNVLSNGSICQHKVCPRCMTDKSTPSPLPAAISGYPKEFRNATSARQSTLPISRTATPVSEENPDNGECTSPDPTSDSEPPSNTSPEATLASDTSPEDSTNGPSQAELTLISVVARRLVDGWTSQFQPAGSEPSYEFRTHAGESSRSGAPNLRRQRTSAGSQDAASALKPTSNPDSDGDDHSDRPRKRRRRTSNPDTEEDATYLRLLACPYQKHDPQRYSERNVEEKEYRGCASCFITDINRLKYLPLPFFLQLSFITQPVLTFN